MIIDLTLDTDKNRPEKLNKTLDRLHRLLAALRKKEIEPAHEEVINTAVHSLNHFHGTAADLPEQANLTYKRIYDYVIKEMNLVPKGHYQTMWLALGMVLFGLPFGMIMGLSLDNMAFLGLGPAMGLPIGIAIGQSKDKQAEEEGRQLDFSP